MRTEEPSFRTQLEGAYLMSASADAVHDWWKARKPLGILHAFGLGGDDIDEDYLARTLLKRKEILIALTLAQFSASSEVVSAAFEKGSDPAFRFLRLAALSNVRCPSEWVPGAFSNGELGCAEWIATATRAEIDALFANPHVGDRFIPKVLQRETPYASLSDERLRMIVNGLSLNPRMCDTPKLTDDGMSWYMEGLPIRAAWRLSLRAPLTREWASTLRGLLARLPAESHLNDAERSESISRWCEAPRERERHADYLDPLEEVVMQIARPGAVLGAAPILAHSERAVRCAAYAHAHLSPSEIGEAARREGSLALAYLIYNERLWRRQVSRDALQESVSTYDANNDRDLARMGSSLWSAREKFRSEHPEWFAEEDAPDESLRPATKSDVATASAASIRALTEHAAALKTLTYFVIGIAIAVVMLVLRR